MSEKQLPTIIEIMQKRSGEEIREARKARGLTQAEVAELAGTNQQTVDRIESGKTQRSKFYAKIAEVVGLAGMVNLVNPRDVKPLRLDREGTPEQHRFMIGLPQAGDYSGIPVFARGSGSLYLTNILPRAFPVEMVEEAYALIVNERDMYPAVSPGDIVVANPHLPPQDGADVVVSYEIDARRVFRVRTLVDQDEENWRFKTWAPAHMETFPKLGSTLVHPIVVKFSKFR
ncbi:helix-turn-helix domain-containing protein [Shinella yambaruensis]|uniref:helix-turn-helix domain-containing protein n=1 Tax=Shinella yambaruensis TaxID=415996 RepID=UPI003D78C8EA